MNDEFLSPFLIGYLSGIVLTTVVVYLIWILT